jgi:uncharacterized membrane protein YdfJ with MMPL/SSD domain
LQDSGLGRLAGWCYDHRRRVLAGWLLAVVAITGLAQWAGSRLGNNFFGSFVIGDPLQILAIFGLGLAAAVLIDATVVRMVLVSAVMQLLGSASWWLPGWIGRAIPSLTIEPDVDHRAGGGLIRPHPVSAAPAE